MTRRFVHILDDLAMGGVTRALENFSHPSLSALGRHATVSPKDRECRAQSPSDVAIVHFTANWRKLPSLAGLKARRGFKTVVLIEHSYTEGFVRACVKDKARFRKMLKLAYGRADTVVAVSRAQRDWIVGSGLASQEKVRVVSQSRPYDDLLRLPAAVRSDGPLRIGAFGRFHPQKGFDLLIEAMRQVAPQDAMLQIAGDGDAAAALAAKSVGLPHVEIRPPFDSPDTFLAGVDVVAIPSRWEAFGLVGTEARAAGRPLIAARVDGLLDQIGGHSFSHEVGCPRSIAEAIRLASSDLRIAERGAAARAAVHGEFDDMIEGWKKLLSAAV